MIATLPSSRPLMLVRSYAVNEVEALRHDGLVGLLVAPDRLGDEERHGLALALLLVEIRDLALADEHVADHERTVILELLLAVEHDPAPPEQLAHHLAHRVLAAGVVGWLVVGELAPVLHRERERRRRGDGVQAGGTGGVGRRVHRVLVEHREGEVGHRAPLDGDLRGPSRLPDDARIDGHLRIPLVARSVDGRVGRRGTVTSTSVFSAGGRTRKWASATGRSPSSPAPATGSAGARPSSSPTRAPRSSSTTSAATSPVRAPTSVRPTRSSTSSRAGAARASPTTTTWPLSLIHI